MKNGQKKALIRCVSRLLLVAEVGFEPHGLRVMSPTSYQAALLRDILFFPLGAGDRGRTGTILTYHGILSPGRLPIPPHRRSSMASLKDSYIISLVFCFVNPFLQKCWKIFFANIFRHPNGFPTHAPFLTKAGACVIMRILQYMQSGSSLWKNFCSLF